MIKNSKLEKDYNTLIKLNISYYLYDNYVYKQLAYIFDSFQDDKSLSIEKQLFNKQLSSIQISVEQTFDLTQNL